MVLCGEHKKERLAFGSWGDQDTKVSGCAWVLFSLNWFGGWFLHGVIGGDCSRPG